jgi:hypothetical protein
MHLNQIVLLRDAIKVDGLSSVLEELIGKNNAFHVKRTSGAIETGWIVVEEGFEYPTIQKLDDSWSVYLSNTKVRKFVPLEDFVGHGDLSAEVVKQATDILDKGVYLAEYENQCLLSGEANHVTEHPSVASAIMPNGSVVRVLIPLPAVGGPPEL